MSRISRNWRKLQSMYYEHGVSAVTKEIARRLTAFIWQYQIQEIRGRVITAHEAVPAVAQTDAKPETECVIIVSAEQLKAFANEIPSSFRDSVDALNKRLGRGCILFLARRPRTGGLSYEVVGYSIAERGVISALGISGKIFYDSLFVHHTEVAHQHRGQGIAQVLTRARNDYCRQNGITKSYNAHTTGNVPSERAFRRFGSMLLGHAVYVSVLGGLFVWRTPWRSIKKMAAQLDRGDADRTDSLRRLRASLRTICRTGRE